MNRNWGRVFAWLLCLALVFGLSAPAFSAEAPAAPAGEGAAEEAPVATPEPPPRESILDGAAITKMVEAFLAEKNVPADRVGVGYCYTATGDEWFFNPDTWFYPGSMYKVPLMMDLSERIRSGEVSPDEQIGGLDHKTLYEYILVYSNNDYAHKVRTFLGGDETWREEVKDYAKLAEYDERYMLYCYFSPRYMTNVLETLFDEPERFPDVTENLLKAEQGHYFRLPEEMHSYDVAQKYGAYIDQENSNWNHTAGIVYTPNPFILTIMTKNVGGAEQFIGQLAAKFKDYTLSVDEKLAAWQREQEAKEAERLAAEEAARLAAEQPAAQQPVTPQQAAARPQGEEPQTLIPTITPDRNLRAHKAGLITLGFLLAAAIIGGIAAVIIVKEKERRRYEAFRRRFEEEMRQEALERERERRAQTPAPERARRPAAQPQTRPRPEAAPAAAQPRTRQPAHPAAAQPQTRRPTTPTAEQQRRAAELQREQLLRQEEASADSDLWIDNEDEE